MNREEISYFGAGPAGLPTKVLEEASKDLLNYEGTGLGVGEISHRGKQSLALISEAVQLIRDLLDVPKGYSIFFMQGGGTTMFSAVVYNLLANRALRDEDAANAPVDYIITGSWSLKAVDEARRLGANVNVIYDSRENHGGKFGTVPSTGELHPSQNSVYTYYCDNETIDGVEFPEPPSTDGILVADMSSNIMSRKFDVSKFSIIFAGAQKNIGLAGITMVIVRDDLLNRADAAQCRKLNIPVTPIILDFHTISKNGSLYNTLPLFPLDVMVHTFRGLRAAGGLEAQEVISKRKAEKVYTVIDAAPDLFSIVAQGAGRGNMNIAIQISHGLTDGFLAGATELKLLGLKGHRSVGGIRISLYNAVSEEAVDKLVIYIRKFISRHQN